MLENQNPKLYDKCTERNITVTDEDDDVCDLFDEREIFGKSITLFTDYSQI